MKKRRPLWSLSLYEERLMGHSSAVSLRRRRNMVIHECLENVFVCSDAANGASLVIRAISPGLQTAEKIHAYL